MITCCRTGLYLYKATVTDSNQKILLERWYDDFDTANKELFRLFPETKNAKIGIVEPKEKLCDGSFCMYVGNKNCNALHKTPINID